MNKVVLTKEEGRYFARTVIRTVDTMLAAARVDQEITKRTTYKTLSTMLTTAGEISKVLDQIGNEPFEFEVFMSSKQKTVLRSCLDSTLTVLNEKIIPEYKRRDPVPEQLVEAEAKVKTLRAMQRKLR